MTAPAKALVDADDSDETVRYLLAGLAGRVSVGPRQLRLPAPSAAQWAQAAALALRAPDHGALRPFRFVVVGDAERPALADLFAQDARRRGLSAEGVDKARQRAHNGPGPAALVGCIREAVDDVPETEQWVSIGAALMNFLNALHLMGFGAKTLSGSSVQAATIRAAFCRDDEVLVAWVLAGTPTQAVRARQSDLPADFLTTWRPA